MLPDIFILVNKDFHIVVNNLPKIVELKTRYAEFCKIVK